MIVYQNNLLLTSLILIGFAGILIIGTVAADSGDGSPNPFIPPLDPDNLPSSAVGIVVGSSSSSTSTTGYTASDQSGMTSSVLAENRMNLTKGQSATHMVSFEDEGTVTVMSLNGAGIEVYSKEGGDWPANVTFLSDYGESALVTATEPLSIHVTPGTWYFTLFPLGEVGSYDLVARQNSGSSPPTNSARVGSFSSSMGASSFSMG